LQPLRSEVQILVIEDDPVIRKLLARLLDASGYQPTICDSAEAGIDEYRRAFYPLVLLDLFLPRMSGFEFCRWLRRQPEGDRSFVLIGTASREPKDLHRILDAGADDYLGKPYKADLLTVRLAVAEQHLKVRAARKQLEIELRQERERLAYLATRDPLTKLFNRAQFAAEVETAVDEARDGPPGAVLYLDLDNFKIVNDTLGHAGGDRLLVQIAYQLRNAIRAHDAAARFGGDEFVVLQKNITLAEAKLTAERIRNRLSDLVFCDSGKSFHVGVSVGVAALDGRLPPEHVMASADAACFAAKARGRNRVEIYQENDRELTRLRTDSHWMAQIKEALKNNGFELWLQPVVEVESGRVAFHEALLRLRTEDGECVSPEVFLPAAERFRMMGEIDRQVLRLAWRRLAADPARRLSINLSGQSFSDPALPEFIERGFAAADVAAERVTFEITETAVISNLAAAQTMIERLRAGGFRFALDDFGSGFSSFTHLKHLTVDYLKIDGGFIRDLAAEPTNLAFVKVINDIAHHLKIHSVAEYVETAESLKALRAIGVDYAQGSYFGMPQAERMKDEG
jgi:diguanylate cyclase (GGDEF)-like protein